MAAIPWKEIIGAGISSFGTWLAAREQPEGIEVAGRPNVAFAAQDEAQAIARSELQRAQARREQPIALPMFDTSGLGGQVNVPGLDISIGRSPGALAFLNQDHFANINAQRAAFNEANPPSAINPAIPRPGSAAGFSGGTGGAASAAFASGDAQRRMGMLPGAQERQPNAEGDFEGDRPSGQNPQDVNRRVEARAGESLDNIAVVIRALLDRTETTPKKLPQSSDQRLV